MEIDYDEQPAINIAAPAPGLALGMGCIRCLLRVRSDAAVMNTSNAKIWVYDENRFDVVPPFLVAEAAGSLVIDEDREQLRQFAESIIEWLARTEQRGGARIHRLR